jgi:hypothetical protein
MIDAAFVLTCLRGTCRRCPIANAPGEPSPVSIPPEVHAWLNSHGEKDE